MNSGTSWDLDWGRGLSWQLGSNLRVARAARMRQEAAKKSDACKHILGTGLQLLSKMQHMRHPSFNPLLKSLLGRAMMEKGK